jgi:CIC family chloride channel protein
VKENTSLSATIDQRFHDFLTWAKSTDHTFMVVAAVVIGCLGGMGAVGFRFLIKALHRVIWGDWNYTVELARTHSSWWILLAPAAGGLIVGPLIYFFAREAKGHGVPEVMEAVALRSGFIRTRVVLVKSLASAVSIASGGSVGREGPIVQIGSALGSTVGQVLRVSGTRLRTFVGCGAAAGIAATFNAPVAGALFAVEIILGDFGVSQFSPIVISSVMATVIARHFLGDLPAFEVPEYRLVSSWELLVYLVLGLLAAVVSVAFVRLLYWCEDTFERLPVRPWLVTAIGGLMVGALGLWHPEVFGVGYEAINEALTGHLLLPSLAVLLGVKLLATSVTIGSGGSGGIFAPSLFLGAMLGGSLGMVTHDLFPGITATPGAYALVGMGAVVAGATHAPITAILIIFELTYDYNLIVPLMGACIISTWVTTRVMRESIYTLKLFRRGVNLSSGRELNILRSLQVGDVMRDEFLAVPLGEHLGTLVEKAARSSEPYLYVVDDQNRLQGVIGYEEIRGGLMQVELLRDLVVAADLARQDVPVVTPQQDLNAVMRIFGGKNRDEIPVVDTHERRRLVGVVTRGHLIEAYNRELMKRDMVSGLVGGMAGTASGAVSLGDDHWMVAMSAPGEFVGRNLQDLNVRRRYGVQVVLLRRPAGKGDRDYVELVPGPDTEVEWGDRLVMVGPRSKLDRLKDL